MTDPRAPEVRSLRELPQDIAPARDLWPAIEARLATEAARSTQSSSDAGTWARRANRMRLFAAAAVIAALAIGIWIGRGQLPQGPATSVNVADAANAFKAGGPRSPYLMGARYTQERESLVKDLEARFAALPPDTRAKVIKDLATIQSSMRDLESALGHDPSNALLQELLVNTYQDEMRVLTVVNEAGATGKGI